MVEKWSVYKWLQTYCPAPQLYHYIILRMLQCIFTKSDMSVCRGPLPLLQSSRILLFYNRGHIILTQYICTQGDKVTKWNWYQLLLSITPVTMSSSLCIIMALQYARQTVIVWSFIFTCDYTETKKCWMMTMISEILRFHMTVRFWDIIAWIHSSSVGIHGLEYQY